MNLKELACVVFASTVAIGSLSGCSTYRSVTNYISSDTTATCPDAAILASTATLPAFDPSKGVDPSNVQYTVFMTNVTTRCDYSKRNFTADANLKIAFSATRPSGGERAVYRVPYYVAVTTSGEIKDKEIRWLQFEFPKGSPTVTVEDAVDSVVVQVDKTKKAYEYHLLVGFQLTKAQIDYNNKMGRYEP